MKSIIKDSKPANITPIERKYYKYNYIQFEQPILSRDGILGGKDFAADYIVNNNAGNYVSHPSAYKIFDGQYGTYVTTTYDRTIMRCNFTMYNPNPISVKGLQIDFLTWEWDSSANHPENTLYYSDDGNNWTVLKEFGQQSGATQTFNCSENTGYHKYYRFMIRTRGSDGADGLCVREITLDALEKIVVESNQSNYDFYIDFDEYKCLKYPERKYFKADTSKPIYNLIQINSPSLTHHLFSSNGANSGGFILFKNNTNIVTTPVFNFEFVLRFIITTAKNNNELVETETANTGIVLRASSTNVITAWIGDGSWRVSQKTTGITAPSNEWISLKLTWDGTNYNFYSSLDGSSWSPTPTATYASTYAVKLNGGICLCGSKRTTNFFNGVVDLSQSYCIIDGERFDFMTYGIREWTSSNYDYYVDIE